MSGGFFFLRFAPWAFARRASSIKLGVGLIVAAMTIVVLDRLVLFGTIPTLASHVLDTTIMAVTVCGAVLIAVGIGNSEPKR